MQVTYLILCIPLNTCINPILESASTQAKNKFSMPNIILLCRFKIKYIQYFVIIN